VLRGLLGRVLLLKQHGSAISFRCFNSQMLPRPTYLRQSPSQGGPRVKSGKFGPGGKGRRDDGPDAAGKRRKPSSTELGDGKKSAKSVNSYLVYFAPVST